MNAPLQDDPKPAAELKRLDGKALRAENMRRTKLAGQHGSKATGSSALGRVTQP